MKQTKSDNKPTHEQFLSAVPSGRDAVNPRVVFATLKQQGFGEYECVGVMWHLIELGKLELKNEWRIVKKEQTRVS